MSGVTLATVNTDLHLRGRGHSDIKSTTGTTNASTTNASTTSDVYSVCSFVGIGC